MKPLLYLYRVLLTGIHLMRTGEIEANLLALNEDFNLPYIHELVTRKTQGAEKGTIDNLELPFHQSEYARLVALLEDEAAKSSLPEAPTCVNQLNDLLFRIRLPA